MRRTFSEITSQHPQWDARRPCGAGHDKTNRHPQAAALSRHPQRVARRVSHLLCSLRRHDYWLIIILQILFSLHLQAKEVILSPPAQTAPKAYVLAIGIGSYQDAFWPKLKWPVFDAKKIAAAITVGNKVETLLLDQQATLANTLAAINSIAQTANKNDALIVYISTHGTLQNNQGDIEKVTVLHDTQIATLATTGMTHQKLIHELEKVSASKKLIIFATCHSGLGKSKLPPEVLDVLTRHKGTYAPLEQVSEGTLILSAGAQGETAREDDNFQADVYTHFFLEGLSTYEKQYAAASAMQAHDYAKVHTYAFTKGQQRPTAQAQFIGEGDLILRGNPNAQKPATLKAYRIEYEGLEISVNGRGKGILPLAFPLASGKNRIALYTEGQDQPLREYEIETDSDITLEEILAGPPFTASMGISSLLPNSHSMQKLVGTYQTGMLARFSYQHKNYAIGLVLATSSESRKEIRQNLIASFSDASLAVEAGFQLQLSPWLRSGLYASLGQARGRIRFQDSENDQVMSFQTKNTPIYELRSNLAWYKHRSLALDLSLGQRWCQYDFDEFGNLNANGAFLALGLTYSFGGKVRML